MHNTVTLDQANRASDRYINSIPRALSSAAALDTTDSGALHQTEVPCTDESSEYEQYLRFAQRSYPISGVDSADATSIFQAFHKWAQTHDFTVDKSNEHHKTSPVSRATNKGGYKMKLDIEYGRFFLGVSSPCVWRHGHPESSSD